MEKSARYKKNVKESTTYTIGGIMSKRISKAILGITSRLKIKDKKLKALAIVVIGILAAASTQIEGVSPIIEELVTNILENL